MSWAEWFLTFHFEVYAVLELSLYCMTLEDEGPQTFGASGITDLMTQRHISEYLNPQVLVFPNAIFFIHKVSSIKQYCYLQYIM